MKALKFKKGYNNGSTAYKTQKRFPGIYMLYTAIL